MKFEFAFQKVLDVKEKEKETAKQEFGKRKQQQLELDEKIEGLKTEKEMIFSQYNNVNRKSVWEILEVQQEIDHVNLQMKQLAQKSMQLHQEVEHKQKILLEKTKEVKVWNLWKDKSKDSFQKEMDRKEQAMLDEMAVLRYSHKG